MGSSRRRTQRNLSIKGLFRTIRECAHERELCGLWNELNSSFPVVCVCTHIQSHTRASRLGMFLRTYPACHRAAAVRACLQRHLRRAKSLSTVADSGQRSLLHTQLPPQISPCFIAHSRSRRPQGSCIAVGPVISNIESGTHSSCSWHRCYVGPSTLCNATA